MTIQPNKGTNNPYLKLPNMWRCSRLAREGWRHRRRLGEHHTSIWTLSSQTCARGWRSRQENRENPIPAKLMPIATTRDLELLKGQQYPPCFRTRRIPLASTPAHAATTRVRSLVLIATPSRKAKASEPTPCPLLQPSAARRLRSSSHPRFAAYIEKEQRTDDRHPNDSATGLLPSSIRYQLRRENGK